MSRVVLSFVLVLGLGGCGDDSGPSGGGDSGTGGDDAGGSMDTGTPPEDGGSTECSAPCDDGLFCNGVETCNPTDPAADADGCVADTTFTCDDGVVCTTDTCSEEMRRCLHLAPDGDSDGHGDVACEDTSGAPIGDDCDDGDSLAFPGATEVCDSHDEDCNPDTIGFTDADGDG